MNEPTLRIVIGTAGSGKSTIARRLARQYAAAYLDKDAMSARFVEAALLAAGYNPGDRESNAFYRERILPLEYDSLLDVAGANLRIGHPVVIDAPFSPYLSDPTFITAAAERFDWPPGRRRGGLRPRVPYDTAGSATETRPRARPVQARPLGRVLGRARGATLRLDRRSAIRILQRRT
jgi:AAA domain